MMPHRVPLFLPIPDSRVMSPDSRGLAAFRIAGPDVCMQRSCPIDIIPPQLNLQPPGDKEFEGVIGFV